MFTSLKSLRGPVRPGPAMSVIVSIIWGIYFEFVMVGNPIIAFGISTLSITVPEKYVFPVWRPYCYFRLSVVLAIIFFELAMVENPKVQLETNKFVVLLLKLVGFFTPSATRVRKNRTAIRGLTWCNGH